MKRFIAAAALAGLVFTPGISFAEAELNTLFKQEQRNLDRVPGLKLRRLLSFGAVRKVDRPVTVSYTREWIDSQPKATGGDSWACLAEALYFEARGETVKGQFAVAEVIMNRVKSSRFPDTACGVINQGTGRKYQCQFTYTCDGLAEVIAEKKAYARVAKVARLVMDGKGGNLTDGATHYHTTAVRPNWSRVFTKTTSIGVHIFYRQHDRTASND